MPMWTPPTPPQDASDVYVDFTACFLYEPSVMPESQLPPLYVKKENKRQRIDPAVATRKHKGVKREEESRVPRSLFDRPTSLLRRDAKMAKLKQSMGLKTQLGKTHQQAMLQRPLLDAGADYPEWLIHEDWALLQAVQTLLELPLNLTTTSPAHIHNWDLIADVVNAASRTYRSSKQCKTRFESTIVPREEGRILYDMNPRKQKKTKGMYKMYNTKNNRPMKTNQIFAQDNNSSVTQLFSHRFDACKAISAKRTPTPRPTLANPTLKNLKHAVVLAENGINYDTPLNPVQVAQIKADRIAKEKKEQLIQQKSQQQQLTQQQLVVQTVSVTSVTPTVTAVTATPALTVVHAGLQAVATAAGATVVPAANLKSMAAMSLGQVAAVQPAAVSKTATLQPAAGSIVVNTHQVAGNLSQIRKLATGQTVVGSLAPNVLTASSAQVANLARSLPARSTSIGVQEIQAAVNQNQARIAGNTVVSTLTTTQLLGQKATVQGATAAQLTSQNKAQLLIQQQQQKQQALLRQQQQRRALLGQVTALQQQKTVAVTTPLLSTQFSPAAVAAANTSAAARLHSPAQAQKRLSTTDMAVLLRQQQTKQLAGVAGVQASTAQVRQVQVSQGALQASMVGLTTAQILSGSQLVSSGPTSQPIATLVKTVATTHAASVATLPVSAVSINLPQKALGKGSAQLGQAAQLQVRSLQQPRKTVAARVALSNPTKTGTPVIMSQRGGQSISLQAFTSLVKQAGGTAGIPQIITSVAAPATTVIGTQIVAGNAGAQTLARLPMASGVGGLNVVAARASAGCGAGTAQVFTHNTHTGALTPTVTLTPAAGGIVKHVQEVLVSPAKQQTMSIQQPGQLKAGVSATNLRQLPPGLSLTPQTASLQQVTLTPTLSLASGNTPTLSLASGNTLTVQQIQAAVKQQQQQQQAQQQAQAPTGAQQAVKQVMQQAQAQAQQRSVVGSAAHLQTSVLTSAPSSVAISGVGGAAALSGVTLGGVSAPTAQTARAQSVVSGSGLVTQLPVGSQGGAGAAGVLIQAAQGGGQAGVAGQLQQQTGDKNAAANTMRLRNPPK